LKAHQKHASITKPLGGHYHRIEFGIIGAPCPTIQKLSTMINNILKSKFSLGFVDADHQAADDLLNSFDSIYTDKINYQRIDTTSINFFGARSALAHHDAILVNGNHFRTDRQIVLINEAKKDSLNRKLDRLDNIGMIIFDEGETEVHDFLKNHISDDSNIPMFDISNYHGITKYILDEINAAQAPLHGLIFAGGESSRMGEDKGKIAYHGIPQVSYLKNMLQSTCEQTWVSKKDAQTDTNEITDTFAGLGPYGGLLSAFRANPNVAYLTVPCDAPFIDETFVGELIANRNTQKIATCFYNPKTEFPEPLITIWEPRAYPVLLEFLSMGYSCPRKVLINSDIEMIKTDNAKKLFNANTIKEKEWAISELSDKK